MQTYIWRRTVRFNFLGQPILKSALNKLKLPQSKSLFSALDGEREQHSYMKSKGSIKKHTAFLDTFVLGNYITQSTDSFPVPETTWKAHNTGGNDTVE